MPPSCDEHDWIFDFVLQFLESDKFDASVMDFVDEKCYIFENEEENKFEYTDIHSEFRDHIEALISSNLGELGISSEMFFESCEKGRNNRDINKQVFERMIAMEDFETFKKLMTKRNMELQLEAIRSYNVTKSPHKTKQLRSSYSDSHEDQEMREAMEASLRCGESERERSLLPVPDELRALLGDGDDKQGPIGEEEMQEILRRSLMEMEMLHRQAELEQADLEQAVALSLALEEERLRLMIVEEKSSGCTTPKKRGGSLLATFQDGDKDSDVKDFKRQSPEDGAKNNRRIEESAPAKELSSSSSSNGNQGNQALSSLNRRKMEDDQLLSQLAENQMSLTILLASDNDEKSSLNSPGFMDDEGNRNRRRAAPRPLNKMGGLSDFADPKPLQGRMGYGAMGALPSISAGAGALDDKKRQAAEEIRRGQDQLSYQRKLEEDLRKQVGQGTPEDAEKRAKHMAEQRDKLIMKKKAERDRKVKEEEERHLKLNADNDDEIPQSVLRAKAAAQAAAIKGESKGGDPTDNMDDKKRSAMRLALARRMKLDLIESEEIKLAQMQEDQFSDLDRKLQQVEQLRRDNKQREIVVAEQLRRQQENIARNVQKSAQELRSK